MENLISQPIIPKPFATNGDKNSIVYNTDSKNMNLEDGFPVIFSTLIKDGGKFIDRKDMNGILNLISSANCYQLTGGLCRWSSAMCNLIGGYPNGAGLFYTSDGQLTVIESQAENNMVEPSASTIDTNYTSSGVTKVWWKTVVRKTDNALSDTSTNPVQNKVVKAAIKTYDDNAVHKTGNETVAGTKTFSSSPVVPTPADNTEATGLVPSIAWVKTRITNWWNGIKDNYLLKTGGTMTGMIRGSTYLQLYGGINNTGYVQIGNANNWGDGATANFKGAAYQQNPGCIEMCASINSNGTTAILRPNGQFTWGGKNIVRSVNNVNANSEGDVTLTANNVGALPTSGGTMTGVIRFTSYGVITGKSDNTSRLHLCGGYDYNLGSHLVLTGKDSSGSGAIQGQFSLGACNSESSSSLTGSPSGKLTWVGKNIVRSVNGVSADDNGNVTISSGGGGASLKRTSLWSNSSGIGTGDVTLSQSLFNFPLIEVIGSSDGKGYRSSHIFSSYLASYAWSSAKPFTIFSDASCYWRVTTNAAGINLWENSENCVLFEIFGLSFS